MGNKKEQRPMNPNESYREMVKLLQSVQTRRTSEVFTDYVDLALDALLSSRTPDDPHEKQYMKVIGKYTKEEAQIFPSLLAHNIMYMRQTNGQECLCQIWEEFASSKELGQFFTPTHVADFCAKITLPNIDWSKYSPDNMCWIADPACGGGRMLMSAIRELPYHERGKVGLYGVDIDWNVCKVCALNLVLSNVNGIVLHGDSLTMNVWHMYEIHHTLCGGEIVEITDKKTMEMAIQCGFEKRKEVLENSPSDSPALVVCGDDEDGDSDVEYHFDKKGQLFFF